MNVIDEFDNFAFAIEPASLAVDKLPGAISADANCPSSTFAAETEQSANPDVVTFVIAILFPNFDTYILLPLYLNHLLYQQS